MSLDDFLRKGLSAQNAGDYGSAVACYGEAVDAYPGNERAVDAAFTALRQVAISQFLIDRFLDNFGWSRERYDGFNQLGHQLSPELVLGRLRELACGAQVDPAVGASMKLSLKLDQFSAAEKFEVGSDDEDNSELRLNSHRDFLAALAAVESEDSGTAISLLVSLIEANPLCGSAHLLLGQLYYRNGLGGLALTHINRAFLRPDDFWSHAGRRATDLINLGEYEGCELVSYKSEFYAIPKTSKYFFATLGGQNQLYEHLATSHVRRMLLQMLPEVLVSRARKLAYRTLLWRFILKPVSLSQFLHGKNLMAVLSAIEQGGDAAR